MILPTLISVSLAPGSYFFCAFAALAIIVAAAAIAIRAIKLRIRAGIVLSRLVVYFAEVSQLSSALAASVYSVARNGIVAPLQL